MFYFLSSALFFLVYICYGFAETKETLCPALYEPVCGVDGKTYENTCIAIHIHSVTVDYFGECEEMRTYEPVYDAPEETEIPKACKVRYDGCNTCQIEIDSGEPQGCTKRFCKTYEEENCLDYYFSSLTERQKGIVDLFFIKLSEQQKESSRKKLFNKISQLEKKLLENMSFDLRREINFHLDIYRYFSVLVK